MRAAQALSLAALVACGVSTPDLVEIASGPEANGPVGVEVVGTSGSEATAEGEDEVGRPAAGAGLTGDSGPPEAMVISDLSWSLHPDMDSLVYVEWTQNLSTEAHVEFSVDEGIWMSSPSVAREAGVNEQLLVGILGYQRAVRPRCEHYHWSRTVRVCYNHRVPRDSRLPR